MIPYDELVAALQAWRARQGLPVSTQQPASAPGASDSARIQARPATPPTPPAPPPGRAPVATQPAAPGGREPLPLAPVDTADENIDHLDESLMEETHYENEGDDFAMSFGANGSPAGANGSPAGANGAHTTTSDETLVGDDVPDAHRTHNSRGDW